MKKLVFVFVCLSALMSCGRRDGGSSSSRSGTANVNAGYSGSAVISGTVTILNDCGASSANLYLGTTYGSSAVASTPPIPSGGSYSFGMSPGSYIMMATAGACSVSGQVQAPNSNVPVCLGSSCGSYKTSSEMTMKAASVDKVSFEAQPLCQWNVYGCQGSLYSGAGNIIVPESRVFFVAKKDTSLVLDLGLAGGNSLVMSVPSLSDKGWDLQIGADGGVKSAGVNYGSVAYGAQIDDKFVQKEEGFCDSRGQVAGRMAEYLKLAGYSDKSVNGFQERWASRLPPNSDLCVYPQTEEKIRQAVTLKASSAVEVRRTWFLVVPRLETAVMKIRPMPEKFAAFKQKPKMDAMAAMKKQNQNRKVANTSDLSAEEVGVGFLLER